MSLKDLEPSIVWNLFGEISKIPRQSKKEDKIRNWVKRWADKNSITWKEDETGNLLLTQDAIQGCEMYPGIILQAHLDMVAQKTPDSTHNFDIDPIAIQIVKDHVTAEGTTLGSDNGIGIAMALASLVDDSC
jgi:dipeptidase D